MRYIDDEIRSIISRYGFTLIEYIDTKNIIAVDKDQYKYKLNLCNLESGRIPSITRANPFAIQNIRNYFRIHHPNCTLLSDRFVDTKTKLDFACNKHHEYGVQSRTFDDIKSSGNACKCCSYDVKRNHRIDDQSIINRCNKLSLTYIGRKIQNKETWVEFTCDKHIGKGVQSIAWYHLRTSAKGCPYCAGKYKTTSDFIEDMAYINPNIEIVGEYSGSERPVDCRCKLCGHEWSPIGRSLKNKQGCPSCTISKGENKVKQYLESHGIVFEIQKSFEDCRDVKKLKFDFYLPGLNMVIEYDGIQHFEPIDFANQGSDWALAQFEKTKLRDGIKNDYCQKHNIKMLRIPYYDFKRIDEILASELSDAFFDKNL